MNASTKIRRPMLAGYARYRRDAVRGQHQVVYPESALVLNESGAAILKLCDGREIGEIVSALQRETGQAGLENDVIDFLQGLAEQGLLRDAST